MPLNCSVLAAPGAYTVRLDNNDESPFLHLTIRKEIPIIRIGRRIFDGEH